MPIALANKSTILKKSDRVIPITAGQSIACQIFPDTDRTLQIILAGNLTALNLKSGETFIINTADWTLKNGHPIALTPVSTNWIQKLVSSKRNYVLQPDANTCQSAAIAMITGGDVWAIREALTVDGSIAGDPTVMGNYLESRVSEYRFDIDASLHDMRSAIDDGYQLIIHTWLTGAGHVIKISGYEASPGNLSYRFICDDPWAEFSGSAFSYTDPDLSGDNVRYSAHLLYAVAVAGQSFGDARSIYRRGELDSNKGGMWCHYCKV